MHLRSLLLLLPLLAACNNTEPTQALPNVTVTAELSASRLAIGDEVVVLVTAINEGTSAVEIDVGCQSFIVVTTEGGADVGANAARICAAVLVPPRVLAPGESATFTERWDGTGTFANGGGTAPLLPGTYRVRGRVQEFGAGFTDEFTVVRREAQSVPVSLLLVE